MPFRRSVGRDAIGPVLRSLQQVYSKPDVTEKIRQLIGRDINGQSSAKRGREGMDDWHILGLAGVRPGCNSTYDQIHDLSENHIQRRAIRGLGSWDEQSEFQRRTIRDNGCRWKPQTIDEIRRLFVALGHEIDPNAIQQPRADSFVRETNIHDPTESSLIRENAFLYRSTESPRIHDPTESSLIRDGLRKILQICF